MHKSNLQKLQKIARALTVSLLITSMGACSFTGLSNAPVVERSSGGYSSADAAAKPNAAPFGKYAEFAGKPGYYTVQPGDTLYAVGRANNIAPSELIAINGIENPNNIEVGQVLRVVPGTGTKTTPVSPSTVSGELLWVWPAAGQVSAKFDGVKNKGMDISNVAGTPVLAAANGVVVVAAPQRGYGNLIVIRHNDHFLSAYAHNKNLLVSENATVRAGQKIAEMGAVDTDHVKLQFQIRKDTKPVDPQSYLPAR